MRVSLARQGRTHVTRAGSAPQSSRAPRRWSVVSTQPTAGAWGAWAPFAAQHRDSLEKDQGGRAERAWEQSGGKSIRAPTSVFMHVTMRESSAKRSRLGCTCFERVSGRPPGARATPGAYEGLRSSFARPVAVHMGCAAAEPARVDSRAHNRPRADLTASTGRLAPPSRAVHQLGRHPLSLVDGAGSSPIRIALELTPGPVHSIYAPDSLPIPRLRRLRSSPSLTHAAALEINCSCVHVGL